MNVKHFFIPIILLAVLILASGCATSVGEARSQEFGRTPGGVDVIPIQVRDAFGQNMDVLAIREDNGNGEYKTSFFSTSGPGFFTTIGPAAVGGVFFWAGMDALEPDRTNVSSTGGNASSDQSQSQRGVNRGINKGEQNQKGTNNGSQGTSGSRNLSPPSSGEEP